MEQGWLEIENLDKLIDFSRRLIYSNFDPNKRDQEDQTFFQNLSKFNNIELAEMNDILPHKEIKIIFNEFIIKKRHKKTKQIRLFIQEDDYENVLEAINSRFVSNIVQRMVGKGLLETAFDAERNDFIFWVNKNEKNQEDT